MSDTNENVLEKTAATGTVISPLSSPGNMNTVGGSGNLGGVLNPTQSRRFIDYIWDSMVLSKEGRRVNMAGNTADIDKIRVGQRLVTKATQADQTGANAPVAFTKVSIVTTKFRLDYELSTETLEDNIAGEALEDHVVRLMATQFGNDVEDIAINGAVGASDANYPTGVGSYVGSVYPTTLTGFIGLTCDSSATGHEAAAALINGTTTWDVTAAGVTAGNDAVDLDLFSQVYNNLPRKFRTNRSQLRFNASGKTIANFVDTLRKVGTIPEEVVTRVIDGNIPRVGGAAGARYQVYGIDLVEVPLYPDTYIDLTVPSNRVWGFQRDVTVYNEFKPKKDTREYTVYIRFGVQLEEKSLISAIKAKTA
jgi:hypothetical protein